MKIAILGAGAVGSWIGGSLALAGGDVTLLTTNRPHIDAISSNGLVLLDQAEKKEVQIVAMTPEHYSEQADVFIVLCKSYQTPAALASIEHCLTADSCLLSLQNGVGHEKVLENTVPAGNVMIGNTLMPVARDQPGVVSLKGEGPTYFNLAAPELASDAVIALRDALCSQMQSAGLDAQVDADILTRIWHKVAFNAGMNAVCAAARCNNGGLALHKPGEELVRLAAEEALAVAAAKGVTVDIEVVFSMIEFAVAHHAQHKASMVQDLLAARKTEIDAINGEIVLQGEQLGVATPVNQVLHTVVKLAETAVE